MTDQSSVFSPDQLVTVRLLGRGPVRRIVGLHTKVNYGYHAIGDTFNVHILDFEKAQRSFEVIGKPSMPADPLLEVAGLNQKHRNALKAQGVTTPQGVLDLGATGLAAALKSSGMSATKAKTIWETVRDDLGVADESSSEAPKE